MDIFTRVVDTVTDILAAHINDLQISCERTTYRRYNVRRYGAVGDGVTNDTAAIAAALAAAAAAGRGIVYFPAGEYLVSGIDVFGIHRITIEGAGHKASVLKLAAGANRPVINFKNAFWITLRDLGIDGNRAAQTVGTNAHGIKWEMDPPWDFGAGDPDFDPDPRIERVTIQYCKGDGWWQSGRAGHKVIEVWCDECDGYGFNLASSADTEFVGCVASVTGKSGFYINGSSFRLVGCKAYWAGRASTTDPHGFRLVGPVYGVTLTSCEAQDCRGQGFSIEGGSFVTLASCVADSNSTIAPWTWAAYGMWQCDHCHIEACVSFDRWAPASHNWAAPDGINGATQKYAFQIRTGGGGGTYGWNQVNITHGGVGGAVVDNAMQGQSDGVTQTGNRLWLNGSQQTANVP